MLTYCKNTADGSRRRTMATFRVFEKVVMFVLGLTNSYRTERTMLTLMDTLRIIQIETSRTLAVQTGVASFG